MSVPLFPLPWNAIDSALFRLIDHRYRPFRSFKRKQKGKKQDCAMKNENKGLRCDSLSVRFFSGLSGYVAHQREEWKKETRFLNSLSPVVYKYVNSLS